MEATSQTLHTRVPLGLVPGNTLPPYEKQQGTITVLLIQAFIAQDASGWGGGNVEFPKLSSQDSIWRRLKHKQ